MENFYLSRIGATTPELSEPSSGLALYGISTIVDYLTPNPLYTGCLKIDAPHKYDNSYCIKSSFIWVLKSNLITSERSNQMTRTEIDYFILQCTWKTKFLRMSSQSLFFFSEYFRQNLSLHPHMTSYCQCPARSGIFCLLVEVKQPDPVARNLYTQR